MSDPIERLEGELARLGGEHEPKPGWQARVLAATAETPKARRPWWQFAIPALVVAAAAVAIVIGTRGPRKPDALALAIEIGSGSTIVRGASASVGDVVYATATGGTYRAVWIYRGETKLELACPGGVGCSATATSITATLTLSAPGSYRIVALDADAPLAPPSGVSYDVDVAAAQRAGARKHTETVEVR